MSQHRATGFTLMELLVVMAIVAILVSITMPVFLNMRRSTRYNTCMENLRQIGAALALYRDDFDSYPAAPRPDYLRNMTTSALPFSAKPTTEEVSEQLDGKSADWDTWREWTSTDAGDPSAPYHYVDLSTCTTTQQKLDTLKAENFGLATLYYLYLDERKEYLRAQERYHCPELRDTARVDRGAVLSNVEAASQPFRSFDPLWNGYNTYDITYNYDQFQNLILEFDADLGYNSTDPQAPSVNIKRQLHFSDAPADTVVCWCYGHTRAQRPITAIEKASPSIDTEQERSAAEDERADEVTLVLWRDGTVLPVRPRLMPQKMNSPSDQGRVYYWLPPFLYSPGDARR